MRDGQRLPSTAITGADWTLTDTASADRLRKMEKAGVPLNRFIQGKIVSGIKTGFNKAFYLSDTERNALIVQDPRSSEIIRPLAIGDDVRRWRIDAKGRWMIFTPMGVSIQKYPAVMTHLKQWQQELEQRYDQGNYWWELRSCDYYDEFDKPKILYPQIMMEPRFVFDAKGTLVNQKCFVIPSNDLFLLGILNSSVVWKFLGSICVCIGDPAQRGRLEPRKEDIARIPIPTASDIDRATISALVQKCLDARGVGCEAWEQEINERVTGLYGL